MKKLTSVTIKEHVGEKVSADFILRGAELVTTSKTSYLKLFFTDAEGSVQGKMWKENINPDYEGLIGKPVRVTGSISAYGEMVEIQADTIEEIVKPKREDLIRTMNKDASEMAKSFISAAIKGINDGLLREFMEFVASKERLSYVTRLCDSSLQIEGGMLAELSGAIRMVNGMYEVSGYTFGGLDGINREIMISGLIAYYFGFAYAQEEKESIMQKSDKGELLGEGFCSAMLVDKLYSMKLSHDKAKEVKTVAPDTIRQIEHICLVLGGSINAKTDEARILKEMMDLFRLIIKEGGIKNGSTGK